MLTSVFLAFGLAATCLAFPTQKRAPAQVIMSCAVNNTVALTFDDGPHVYSNNVSDILTAAGARGTFFFNGNNYGCIYSEENANRVKYYFDHGHQIASHTWRHAHLNTLSVDQLNVEFSRVDEALQKIAGVIPAFMRPPYGEYNDNVLEVAGSRGQKVAIWDFDSGDSTGKTAAQSNQLYDEIAARHPSSILALNHEVYKTTAENVLTHAIATLQRAGYSLVTLAECLGPDVAPYQSIGIPAIRDNTWTC